MEITSKARMVSLLKENIEENLHEFRVGKNILDSTQISHTFPR